MTDSPSTIPTWYRDPRAEEAMADGHAPAWYRKTNCPA